MPRRPTRLACAAAVLLGLSSPVGTLVGTATAAAPERTVSATYLLPGGTTTGTTTSTPLSPAVTVTARGDEDRVTVTANDHSGVIALAVDITPSGGTATARHVVCGSGALALRGGSSVAVTPLTGRCPDGRVSLPQGGSVLLSFHRKVVVARRGIATPGHRFALVVGVRDYAGGTHDTVGGVGDVLAVRRALIGSGWQPSHIRTLTDGQATAQAIRDGLTWLAEHSSPQTFSLFHYSGHVCIDSRGPCAAGHAYLWGQDNRFVRDDEVVSRLLRVQGRQWLDLSACEGGAFDRGYSSPTRLFTGAAQADETAYEEPDWNESVWSGLTWDYGYNRGLADPHRTAMHATIAQMASYGVTQAAAYTRKQPRGPQHPVLRGGDRSWSLSAPPGG